MRMLLAVLVVAIAPLASIDAGERFACNMKALTAAERARHQELSKTLLAAVSEQRELANGYAFRLPPSELTAVAEWVSFERACCPFFTFAIEQGKDLGPLWLRITGSKGVKAFIVEEFQLR